MARRHQRCELKTACDDHMVYLVPFNHHSTSGGHVCLSPDLDRLVQAQLLNTFGSSSLHQIPPRGSSFSPRVAWDCWLTLINGWLVASNRNFRPGNHQGWHLSTARNWPTVSKLRKDTLRSPNSHPSCVVWQGIVVHVCWWKFCPEIGYCLMMR